MALWAVTPTRAQFIECDWQKWLDSAEHKETHYYSFRLSEAASEAKDGSNEIDESVYRLLAQACSIMLKPESRDHPFAPMAELQGSRTVIPDDISDEELVLLQTVAPDIADPELRARLADLVWFRVRHYPSVLIAISAYLQSAERLQPDMWHEAVGRTRRALNLAAAINNEAEFAKVIQFIEIQLHQNAVIENTWLLEGLMQLLVDYGEGSAEDYASLCERRAHSEEEQSNWREARDLWQMAAKWHGRLKAEANKRQCDIAAAETYVFEAQLAGSGISSMVFMNKALEALSRIPGTEARQDEVKAAALDAQRVASSEMTTVEVPIEASELGPIIKQAREALEGLSVIDSLRVLSTQFRPSNASELRSNAEELIQEFPIRFLVSSVTLNENDRIVSQSFGSSEPAKEHEAHVRKEMFSLAAVNRIMATRGICEPMRRKIILQHRASERDFRPWLMDNPLVSAGREGLFARGLLAGLHGDFTQALHILIPQLEHSLRNLLEKLGEPSVRVDREGRQFDHDLNTLLYTAALSKFLGEDLVFELRGLLVEGESSNLHNELAHGLLSPNRMEADDSRFFWWFMVWYVELGTRLIVSRVATTEPDRNTESQLAES